MKQSFQFSVAEESTGQRLDQFLASRLDRLSRMRIASIIAQGACTVNQTVMHAGYYIRSGDLVEVMLEENAPTAMTPEPIPLEIIHEDAHLLVVNKPAGMLVHPTRSVKSGTLANALAYYLNRTRIEESSKSYAESENLKSPISNLPLAVRPGIVHRLDRATSGLMVIAKQQRALSILSRHFHHRLIKKQYLALVHGCLPEDEYLITAPVGREPEGKPKWKVMENGKAAETRLRVRKRKGQMTLVELEPVTGRTNQLRIHCAYMGNPIIGDRWYGDIDTGTRLCLHATRLAFNHPADGEWIEFTSPLPAEIMEILNAESGRSPTVKEGVLS